MLLVEFLELFAQLLGFGFQLFQPRFHSNLRDRSLGFGSLIGLGRGATQSTDS